MALLAALKELSDERVLKRVASSKQAVMLGSGRYDFLWFHSQLNLTVDFKEF